jgi:hypothetical protein
MSTFGDITQLFHWKSTNVWEELCLLWLQRISQERKLYEPDSKASGRVVLWTEDMASILGRKISLLVEVIPARRRAKHLPIGYWSSGSGEIVPTPLYLQPRLSMHGAVPPFICTRTRYVVWLNTEATLFSADMEIRNELRAMPSHMKYTAQNYASKNGSRDK